MNKALLFSLVAVAMIFNSCGTQLDYAELQTSDINRLRSQAEDHFRRKEFDKSIDAYKTLLSKIESPSTMDYFNLGRSYYFVNSFKEAESVFTLFIKKHETLSMGYTWRARARAGIDSKNVEFLAKSDYEKVIELHTSEPDKHMNSMNLIEPYLYMGFYYFSKSDFEKSRECYNQVINLNPDPVSLNTAREALKGMDKLKK